MRQSLPEAQILDSLATVIEERSGLRFAASRRGEFASKVANTYGRSRCRTWSEYLQRLSNPDDTTLLDQQIEDLTVGETYFFRHRAVFDVLETKVLPALMVQHAATRQLRIWCAGCATGEEAYSIAIIVRRLLAGRTDWNVNILATDINRSFLRRAEGGLFGEWSFRETDDLFKEAYFQRVGKRYRIKPEIRDMVTFAHLNLIKDEFPTLVTNTAAQHVIMCRNVLMYFAPQVSTRIVERFRSALLPGGWLMIGASDPFPGLMQGFEATGTPDAMLYYRPERAPETPTTALPVLSRLRSDPAPRPVAQAQPTTTAQQAVAVEREPVQPPAVAVVDWRDAWSTARASADQGDWATAMASCRRAIEAAPQRPEPYYLLGILHDAQGDSNAARLALRQALYVDRTFAPAHLALAASHRRAGRAELARQALHQAQRLLEHRDDTELILPDEGLTVGGLRDAILLALPAVQAAKETR